MRRRRLVAAVLPGVLALAAVGGSGALGDDSPATASDPARAVTLAGQEIVVPADLGL